MALIVLTGLDGSGKTTHARALVEALAARGAAVRYRHAFGLGLLSPAARLWSRVQPRIARPGTASPVASRGRGGAARRLAGAAIALALVVAGLLRAWTYAWRVRGVVVFDRYFYDDLVRCEWKFGLRLSRAPRLARLVPAPDLIIYLTPSPEVAWRRKTRDDATLDAFREKGALYRAWMASLRAAGLPIVEVPTDGRAIAEISGEIIAATANLGSRVAV